jgi:acyl carrier protein
MASLDRREIEERMRPIMVKRWGASRGMVRKPYAYGDPAVQQFSLVGIDLLDMAGLIMDLEDAFEITIPDEDWMNRFSTGKDVVGYVEQHSKKEN